MAIPSNLTEQIKNIKELDISYRMLHNSARINDINSNQTIEIPYESLINKYKNILADITVELVFDDRLSRQYLFNPKLLSYELYGTVELWSELLRLNNWSSVVEFRPTKIKVYNPKKLKSFLNEILILEEKI